MEDFRTNSVPKTSRHPLFPLDCVEWGRLLAAQSRQASHGRRRQARRHGLHPFLFRNNYLPQLYRLRHRPAELGIEESRPQRIPQSIGKFISRDFSYRFNINNVFVRRHITVTQSGQSHLPGVQHSDVVVHSVSTAGQARARRSHLDLCLAFRLVLSHVLRRSHSPHWSVRHHDLQHDHR